MRWVLLVAAVCSGCGPEHGPGDAGPSDAGGARPDGSGHDGGPPVPRPAPPEAPRFTPCPEGWREVEEEGIPVCDPWPEGGPHDCADHEAHFPGRPGCETVGAPCPEGDFAVDAPDDAVFARAGATGGDGSRAAPFGTVTEALAAAPDGGTVALARGRFEELVRIERDVTLIGACAAETTLAAPPAAPAAIYAQDATVGLRNLRVVDGAITLFLTGSDVEASGLLLEGGRQAAVSVLGGTVTVDEVVARGLTDQVASAGGEALVTLRGLVAMGGAGSTGAFTANSGTLVVEDAVVRGVGAGAVGAALVLCTGDSRCRVERGVFEENGSVFVLATVGTAVELVDTVLARPPGAVTATDQDGLIALDASRMEATRVRIHRAHGQAMLTGDPGSAIRLEDVLVTDVRENAAAGYPGRAAEVSHAAALEATRVHIARAREIAVLVTGGTASLTDVAVVDTRSDTMGTLGRGLHVQLGGRVTAERLSVERSREIGVMVATEGSRAMLTDVTIRDTLPRACEEDGRCPGVGGGTGAGAYLFGRLTIERFRITGNALAGVQVARDGELDLSEGVVSHNPIGANVQVPRYDLERLSRRVVYRDNGRNLDSAELPVPRP